MALTTTWLGQSGLLFQFGGQSIVVDPWLSPHPARAGDPAPPARWPAEITRVLITHGHGDHLDVDGLLALSRRTSLLTFVAPEPHVATIRAAFPATPIVSVRPSTATPDGIQVFPAWHGIGAKDGYTTMIAPDGTSPHVGYGLKIGGVAVYLSGDTISDPELVAAVKPFAPDVAFLPVNGRDARREAEDILGNMEPVEAFAFADAVGATVVVPLHHDGVTGNTKDIGEIARAASTASAHLILPARGRPFTLSGSTA